MRPGASHTRRELQFYPGNFAKLDGEPWGGGGHRRSLEPYTVNSGNHLKPHKES